MSFVAQSLKNRFSRPWSPPGNIKSSHTHSDRPITTYHIPHTLPITSHVTSHNLFIFLGGGYKGIVLGGLKWRFGGKADLGRPCGGYMRHAWLQATTSVKSATVVTIVFCHNHHQAQHRSQQDSKGNTNKWNISTENAPVSPAEVT